VFLGIFLLQVMHNQQYEDVHTKVSIWFFFFQLAGDPILNFVLATVADSPVCVFLFFTLDRIGRRYTLFLTHVTLGLSCLGQ
jgi:hypothetical protein